MHVVSSYRSNRPTNTNAATNTQTGPTTIHCAAKRSANIISVLKCNSVRDWTELWLRWIIFGYICISFALQFTDYCVCTLTDVVKAKTVQVHFNYFSE